MADDLTPPPGDTTPPAPPPGDTTPPPGDTTPSAPPPGDTQGYWPNDWREKYANGDDKLLKRLARFDSPKAVIDSFTQLEKKLSSGALKSGKPKDATPEQIAAWRQENGIPSDIKEYDLSLPDGMVIGEDDKPMVEGFLKEAHSADYTPDQVKQALSWYYKEQDRQLAELQESDLLTKRETEDALRQEWGPDYRRNVNLISGLLDSAPAGVKDAIMGSRATDGSPMMSHPDVLRWLTGMALELNPQHTVVAGHGPNAAAAIDNEIATIEQRMATDRAGYFKDEKMQARYRDLISVRDRIKQKAA